MPPQQNLSKRDVSGARAPTRATQYDSAAGFIRRANDALKIKNYMFAKFNCADKAAIIAGQLVKG